MARIGKSQWLPGGRAERWCFPCPRGHKQIEEKLFALQHNRQVHILCMGEEVGEEGYQHWQGFVEFTCHKTARQLKELVVKETDVEKAKGSRKSNITSCSKERHGRYEVNVGNWNAAAHEKREMVKKEKYKNSYMTRNPWNRTNSKKNSPKNGICSEQQLNE
jgi:hypothetical protein